MAHALRIDTLQLAEDLEAAKGDPRKTARVIGGAIGSIDISDLATKADIKTLETRMEALATKEDIAEVRTEIAQSTNRAIYTLGGLVTVLFVLDRIIPLFGIAN